MSRTLVRHRGHSDQPLVGKIVAVWQGRHVFLVARRAGAIDVTHVGDIDNPAERVVQPWEGWMADGNRHTRSARDIFGG